MRAMIVFTRHAVQRMRERNIARSQIVNALAKPDSATLEEGDVTLFRKRYGKKILGVVTEVFKQKFIVITAYWV
ncbi:hypothetical protein A2935_01655 [Candidatus Wolfebacteria bacterium RIFCSPLOWO2_01_FULL_47_17b]|uniref:DUF4258 domain-containing protein n=1 Tax=Candidatus Wolfebacteria bacterium RIFCSPLOWO2_01_FULL_47_17b TaxID=1802558 RepID=A0A1F8E024_9BACT|nr:MAG: hypothetical protein A2935_01655 [Candidatus Wolfebacteria bacterium RIFCSPLOWO2_01_FULL_47_17b]